MSMPTPNMRPVTFQEIEATRMEIFRAVRSGFAKGTLAHLPRRWLFALPLLFLGVPGSADEFYSGEEFR